MSISSKWDVILLPYSFIKTGQQDLSLTPLKIISSLRRLLLFSAANHAGIKV